jgi:hypothetical protein
MSAKAPKLLSGALAGLAVLIGGTGSGAADGGRGLISRALQETGGYQHDPPGTQPFDGIGRTGFAGDHCPMVHGNSSRIARTTSSAQYCQEYRQEILLDDDSGR